MIIPQISESASPAVVPAEALSDTCATDFAAIANRASAKLLFVVEGVHDIRFLRRISRTLHAADPALPDLAAWEAAGRLWELLPGRACKRYRERVKHWLNTAAAERMTPERLRESDRQGDIARWLQAAASLAELP